MLLLVCLLIGYFLYTFYMNRFLLDRAWLLDSRKIYEYEDKKICIIRVDGYDFKTYDIP